MKTFQSYKCALCGNIVEVTHVGGGQLVCCGKPMDCITEKLTPVLLMKAFAGESQARNKYDFFASVAKKEGLEQISAFFAETALNEKEHAKLHFKTWNKLQNGNELDATSANLQAAFEGENYENTVMYPEFAKVAEEEGYPDIAKIFIGIGKIEEYHEKRYRKLKDLLDGKKVFADDGQVTWFCRNCGHLHTGPQAPAKCPVCNHPQAYFERLCENY